MFSLLWLISLKEGRLICGSWYQRFLSKLRWPCQTGSGWGRSLRQGGCGGVKPSGTKERRCRTQTPASEAVSVFVQVTPPPTFYHVVKLFDPSCKWGRLRRNKQQLGIKPQSRSRPPWSSGFPKASLHIALKTVFSAWTMSKILHI